MTLHARTNTWTSKRIYNKYTSSLIILKPAWLTLQPEPIHMAEILINPLHVRWFSISQQDEYICIYLVNCIYYTDQRVDGWRRVLVRQFNPTSIRACVIRLDSHEIKVSTHCTWSPIFNNNGSLWMERVCVSSVLCIVRHSLHQTVCPNKDLDSLYKAPKASP